MQCASNSRELRRLFHQARARIAGRASQSRWVTVAPRRHQTVRLFEASNRCRDANKTGWPGLPVGTRMEAGFLRQSIYQRGFWGRLVRCLFEASNPAPFCSKLVMPTVRPAQLHCRCADIRPGRARSNRCIARSTPNSRHAPQKHPCSRRTDNAYVSLGPFWGACFPSPLFSASD
jgi:hypothetical protein